MNSSTIKVRNWTPEKLPDLTGKTYVITGGNSGIGFEAARILGEHGGNVVIACRNEQKAADAADRLSATAKGTVETLSLDLSSMEDVRRAAKDASKRFSNISALINNAGIMQTPETRTKDGFELQLATNHLGHFLWTGMLFDKLDPDHGRIVNVSSIGHKLGKMHFDDLMFEKSYDPTDVYCQSKLANMHFTMELSRWLKEKSSKIKAVACHPGYSATKLQSTGPEGFFYGVYKLTDRLLAQSSEKGCLPTLLAAAGEEAVSGGYYGPTGFLDIGGPVGTATIHPKALNEGHARKLWQASEELTGFHWDSL